MTESKVLENENTELVETEATEVETYEEESGFKNLALVGSALAGVTALGVVAFRKFKEKKTGKPHVKKRLKWVEVEDNDVIEVNEAEDDENVEETA